MRRQRDAGGLRRRAGLVAVTAALGLAACSNPGEELAVGTVGYVKGFAGAVAADEPRAVLVGRDALAAGGTAADAAAAMALTMAVTLPSSVGLGGGGVCLIYDPVAKTVQTLDFLPPAGPGPIALPALPRGLFALQARQGRLRWERIVAPAENLARFGERVSRALAGELAGAAAPLASDLAARRVFLAEGRPLAAGDMLTQVDLAATLGRLRQRGVGTLYGGRMGHEWVQAARAAGSPLTIEDLRAWQPRLVETTRAEVGYDTLHFPPAGVEGHQLASLWRDGALSSLPAPDAGRGTAGGASLAAVDASGRAVTCGLTLNGPFGTGRLAPGLGFFLAASAPATGQSAVPLAVALRANHNSNEFRMAAAAAGGGAAANLGRVLAATASDAQAVPQAVNALAERPSGPAPVSALACANGLPSTPGSCLVQRDPRGAGFGTVVGAQ